MRVDTYNPDHLPHLTALVNTHLGAAVPGWAVPEATLARQLTRDDGQYVTDPWVAERATVCGEDHRRGVATALVRATEEWAHRRGLPDVRLDVYEFNAGARRLYERLGDATFWRRMRKDTAAAGEEGRS